MDERSHPPTPRFARGYPSPQSKVMAPYTELDIFPSLSNGANQSPARTCRRRRGLASLPFAFELPSEAVERVSSFNPSTPAANVLDALRSRTLLDLSCMREFSLLRTKPLPERNLSCLSVSSAYNMQTEQLQLQHLAIQGLPNDQKSSDARRPSPVKRQASKLVGLRSRIAHAHRKILHTAEVKADHVSHTRRSPPSIPASRPREPQQKAQPSQRPRTEPTSSATLSVAELHGFLQEQDLAALMSATGFSRAELFARWARFKALCSMAKSPHGVDKETLRHGVPQLSVEDQFFVDRAFDVLDSDGSGALDWPEFIAALSALEKGDASRRIEFLFHAYDLNSDGFIQRHEVQLFFLASLLVPQTPQALEVARHFVDKIFISLGREQFDCIRVDDAMTYLREHPTTDAYSILGRTMISTPPSTPVPLGIRPRRRPA